jgi:beta-phosphoglucomutase
VFATLFDFDGVLVDSEPAHLAAFNDVLSERGIQIGEREYAEQFLSLDDAGVFRALLTRDGNTLREAEVRALVQAKAPCFMARFESTFRVFPGARELLLRRAARGPVGIVSGAFEKEIAFALDRMGVRDAVQFVVAADHTPASKPDPAPYRAGLDRLARLGHSGGVVAIEDSLGGVASAHAAGIPCIAVTHAYASAQLLGAGARATAAVLGDLTDALLEGTT